MAKAIVFTEYGGPEVLHLADVPDTEPGPGEVRIRVRAAGVQPADTRLRSGAWQSFMPVTFPARLGFEAAGVVDAVGPSVEGSGGHDFFPGDEVLGPVAGGYADTVVADDKLLVRKPIELSWAEAGALSASGQTASTALDELSVGRGETLLVHAAAGGVGQFAIQLAAARGARVIGTASEQNHDFVRSLGAIPVAYGPGLADRVRALAPEGVDAAFDAAGGQALEVSVELVADRDRIGTIVDQAAAKRLGLRWINARRSAERLGALAELCRIGQLNVAIWKEFPLAEAAAAHRESEGRHLRGKIVLVV
jgi:enoyl reductase